MLSDWIIFRSWRSTDGIVLYADDAKIIFTGIVINKLKNKISTEVLLTKQFLRDNNSVLNVNKTTFIHKKNI